MVLVLLLEATRAWWPGDRVFVLEVGCFIWLGIVVLKKNQIDHMSMEQFKISKFIARSKLIFFPSI
jgi:hypothetical protein